MRDIGEISDEGALHSFSRRLPVFHICGMEKEKDGKGGGKVGEALLTVKGLSAWYSNGKMILSDF